MTTITFFKRSKYHAKPAEIDGVRFASQGEANRYLVLRDRLQRGEIHDLRLQVAYPLRVNGQLICTYKADFVYEENGRTTVEDFKGMSLQVYRLKAKMMLALYGIAIYESGRPSVKKRHVRHLK